jgi:hypothetical protein
LRNVKVYEVHDEKGCLRKFWFKDEAERFAGDEYKVIETREVRFKKPKFDINQLQDAPF